MRILVPTVPPGKQGNAWTAEPCPTMIQGSRIIPAHVENPLRSCKHCKREKSNLATHSLTHLLTLTGEDEDHSSHPLCAYCPCPPISLGSRLPISSAAWSIMRTCISAVVFDPDRTARYYVQVIRCVILTTANNGFAFLVAS